MKWNILSVDDDAVIGSQIKELLQAGVQGEQFFVDHIQDFDIALENIEKSLYDIAILDVFKGEQSLTITKKPGIEILGEIQKRCFIPVIFYTALPSAVNVPLNDLVQVVHKTSGGLIGLKSAVEKTIKLGLSQINRQLINYFLGVQGQYMWKFVYPSWPNLTEADKKSLAYLLARRLATSFSRENIEQLISTLSGSSAGASAGSDEVHPLEYYVYPSFGGQFYTGDIMVEETNEAKDYYVILTPSCDLVIRMNQTAKAENVTAARCIPLSLSAEAKAWQNNKASNDKKKQLKKLIRNNKQARFHFLPGTFFTPDLIVDFQAISSVPFDELKKLKRIASLDNPFAEALLNRFGAYINRIGTPDLYDLEIERILNTL